MQILFYILFFFTPLVFLPVTSELFEFNKMVFVYIMTTVIITAWLLKCLKAKKFLFRRTPLNIPLLLFLLSQTLSTIFSIDQRTSLLGYYSRFNGGLLSLVCYSLLYWAFVSNMDRVKTLSLFRYILLSAVIVSLYGILQHFGIDKAIWVQDVQNRVFSTLGQPNWLAAYLVALMPISWAFALECKSKRAGVTKLILLYSFTLLLYIALLFTKSRSGLLGFAVADIIFWSCTLFKFQKKFLKEFLFFNVLFLIIFFVVGSPITSHQSPVTSNAPALETGGTDSGIIRKIIWKGAIDIWRHNPLFGSGVETFAFSYYQFRPKEHNLVSEWDFLYNKAHNEFLNLAANTGTFGLLSYLILIGMTLFLMIKTNNYALLAGYTGILITNFFGFSVVLTSLFFFLFPAFAVTFGVQRDRITSWAKYKVHRKENISNLQKLFIFIVLGTSFYVLSTILRYWSADVLYAKAQSLDTKKNYTLAREVLDKAIGQSGNEAIFHSELSLNLADDALSLFDNKKSDNQSVERAIEESNKSIVLSPANLNLLRNRASLFLKLAIINLKYLGGAKDALLLASAKAPTDAKILYNLGLIYARTGEEEQSMNLLEKTIDLKPNYRDARLAYALMLIDKGDTPKAKEELKYILEKINPEDIIAKEQLKKLQ